VGGANTSYTNSLPAAQKKTVQKLTDIQKRQRLGDNYCECNWTFKIQDDISPEAKKMLERLLKQPKKTDK